MTTPRSYTVQLAEWSQHGDALAKLRSDVFVEEQKVPAEVIMDELDAGGVHVVARDASGNVIGTGRLVLQKFVPRIGRMAVVKSLRSTGVGGQILQQLCNAAKQRGFGEVMVHSQTHASPFYFKHGFLSHGNEFFEAGIPHQEMRKHI